MFLQTVPPQVISEASVKGTDLKEFSPIKTDFFSLYKLHEPMKGLGSIEYEAKVIDKEVTTSLITVI